MTTHAPSGPAPRPWVGPPGRPVKNLSRRGYKTANITEAQIRRIDAAVAAGYARNRDEFIRMWTEVGLIVTSLLPTSGDAPDE